MTATRTSRIAAILLVATAALFLIGVTLSLALTAGLWLRRDRKLAAAAVLAAAIALGHAAAAIAAALAARTPQLNGAP